MKRSILFAVLFSTALAVGTSAQSTGGQTPSQPGSSDQITVTGCLQSGDSAGATGTSGAGSTGAGATGAAGSRGSRGEFVLTNARMGTGSPSGGTGASNTGTAGRPTGSPSSSIPAGMTRLKLEGRQPELQKYANSQVEVSGKLDKSAASGSIASGSATAGATGATGATGSGAAATGSAADSRQDIPTLRVSSVRQVSPTCSGS
jgi:hypothetical protein